MKFSCEQCHAKYSIADERVRGKILRIRCKKCGNIIEVRDTGLLAEDAAQVEMVASKAAAAAGGAGAPRLSSVPAEAPEHEGDAEKTVLFDYSRAGAPGTPPEPPKDTTEWYVAIDGQQMGPMSIVEARTRVRTVPPTARAYAWRDGMQDWLKLREVPELRDFVPAPLPPPRPSQPAVDLAAEKAAAERAAQEQYEAKRLLAEKAFAERVAAEKAAAERAAAEEDAAARAAAEKDAADRVAAERLAAELAVAREEAAAERLAAERVAAEQRAAAERAAAEKAVADERAAAEQAAAQRAAAEKAAKERADADEKILADQRAAEAKAEREKASLAKADAAQITDVRTTGELAAEPEKTSGSQVKKLGKRARRAAAEKAAAKAAAKAPAKADIPTAKPEKTASDLHLEAEPTRPEKVVIAKANEPAARKLSAHDHDLEFPKAVGEPAHRKRPFPIATAFIALVVIGAGVVLLLGALDVVYIPYISSERGSGTRGVAVAPPQPTESSRAGQLLRRDPLLDRDGPKIVIQQVEVERAKSLSPTRGTKRSNGIVEKEEGALAASTAVAAEPAKAAAPPAPQQPAAPPGMSELEKRVYGQRQGGPVPAVPEHLLAKSAAPAADSPGGLSRDTIALTIKRYNGGIRNCYEKQLRQDSSVRGRLTISLKIGRNGKVVNASIEDDAMKKTLVGSCVVTVARSWRFPTSNDDSDFDYSYILEPTH